MPDSNDIPPDLESAAHVLEGRLRQDKVIRDSGVRPWRTSASDWKQLKPDAAVGVPPWLPALLNRFEFCGVIFQLPHIQPESGLEFNWFEFLDPVCYPREVVSWIADLPGFGFHAFAADENADLWVATAEKGPSGDVYLLEQSSWDGDLPTLDNGLVHAHTSLAPLFSKFSVWNTHERRT